MKYIGIKASSMIAGAFTPASNEPPLATTRPRLAARLYAGAVEAIPTTTLDTRPRAPDFRPLSDAASGNPSGAAFASCVVMAAPGAAGGRGEEIATECCCAVTNSPEMDDIRRAAPQRPRIHLRKWPTTAETVAQGTVCG